MDLLQIAKWLCHRCGGKGGWHWWDGFKVAFTQCGACNGVGWIRRP